MGIWIGDMRFSSVQGATKYFEKQRRYKGAMGKLCKLIDKIKSKRQQSTK